MATKTVKKNYQRHIYSGPPKSKKRVLAGLKRYTDLRSRVDFWREKQKRNNEYIGIHNNNPNTSVLNKPIRTYSRAKPLHIEVPNAQATVPTISMEVESDKDPLQINFPQPVPRIDSVKLNIEDPLQINCPRPDPPIDSVKLNIEDPLQMNCPLPDPPIDSVKLSVQHLGMEVESDKDPLQINCPRPDPPIDSVKLNIEDPLQINCPLPDPPIDSVKLSIEDPLSMNCPQPDPPIDSVKLNIEDPLQMNCPRPDPPIDSVKLNIEDPLQMSCPRPDPSMDSVKLNIEDTLQINCPQPDPPIDSVKLSIEDPLQMNCPQPDPPMDSVKLNIEASADNGLSGISGYRIVELRHVIEWCFKMERHKSVCESSQIEFVHETHNGFQSNLTFKCSMCDKTWKHCTESTDKVNTSFVWGTVTAGSYYTQAAHITNLMDIPSMSAETFRRTENKLGQVWCEHLTEEIKKAGEEERSIAVEKGHVSPDGVPFTTVYVDGGLLKQSYGHNFDSPTEMACIVGKETKKCLFLGVRNKYCYTCHYYEKRSMTIEAHNCCKNFTGPFTVMESNIILEGFQKSVEMHQLRYLKFIGDGDSSFFANLKDKVPYGNFIKKT